MSVVQKLTIYLSLLVRLEATLRVQHLLEPMTNIRMEILREAVEESVDVELLRCLQVKFEMKHLLVSKIRRRPDEEVEVAVLDEID